MMPPLMFSRSETTRPGGSVPLGSIKSTLGEENRCEVLFRQRPAVRNEALTRLHQANIGISVGKASDTSKLSLPTGSPF